MAIRQADRYLISAPGSTFLSIATYLIVPRSATLLHWVLPVLLFPVFQFAFSCLPILELLYAWESSLSSLQFDGPRPGSNPRGGKPEELMEEKELADERLKNYLSDLPSQTTDARHNKHIQGFRITLVFFGLFLFIILFFVYVIVGLMLKYCSTVIVPFFSEFFSNPRTVLNVEFVIILVPLFAGLVLLAFLLLPLAPFTPFMSWKLADEKEITIDQSSQPRLTSVVEAICRSTGSRYPSEIKLNCSTVAAVRASNIRKAAQGKFILSVGVPLLCGLSVTEFTAILAHELTHTRDRIETLTWLTLTPLNRRLLLLTERFPSSSPSSSQFPWFSSAGLGVHLMALIVLPVLRFFRTVFRGSWISLRFSSALLSKQMEVEADRIAASIAGGGPLESAMLKIAVLEEAAEIVAAEEASGEAQLCTDLPVQIRERAEALPIELRQRIIEDWLSRPTGLLDSHPPRLARISAARNSTGSPLSDLKMSAASLLINRSQVFAAVSSFARESKRISPNTPAGSAIAGAASVTVPPKTDIPTPSVSFNAYTPILRLSESQVHTEQTTCSCCKERPSNTTVGVSLYRLLPGPALDRLRVSVPCCTYCRKWYAAPLGPGLSYVTGGVYGSVAWVGIMMGTLFFDSPEFWVFYLAPAFILAGALACRLGKYGWQTRPKFGPSQYSSVMELTARGYKVDGIS